MRSRLAARSTRLVLAAAAVTALAATATACSSDSDGDGTQNAGSATSPAAGASVTSDASESPTIDASVTTDSNSGADSGSSSDNSAATATPTTDTDAAKKDYYGQACGTSDLTFTVSEKSQAGGYLLVTAKANPGITCWLDGKIPNAAFGSGTDTVVAAARKTVTDTIKLSGSTVAYAGINPKTTNTNYGKEFDQLIIAITDYEGDPVSLKLPSTAVVDKPTATTWTAKAADAVPYAD